MLFFFFHFFVKIRHHNSFFKAEKLSILSRKLDDQNGTRRYQNFSRFDPARPVCHQKQISQQKGSDKKSLVFLPGICVKSTINCFVLRKKYRDLTVPRPNSFFFRISRPRPRVTLEIFPGPWRIMGQETSWCPAL